MIGIIKLSIAALIPVVAAVCINSLDKRTGFGKMNYMTKQILIGIVFGGIAIIGTEWGIPINGAQVNCRDAAVMTAGLMFGGPAGIIAGTIGAVERWFAIYWGIGTYTRVACTVATFVAGIYSALLRKYMFENKRPWWLVAFATGAVIEIFHLTLVFLTHINETQLAMSVVGSCTVPMLLANALSIALCAFVMSVLDGSRISFNHGTLKVTEIIQRWLMIIIMVAFVLSSIFVYEVQDGMTTEQTRLQLENTISEVEGGIDSGGTPAVVCSTIKPDETGFVYIFDSEGNLCGKPESAKDIDIDDIETGDNGEMVAETVLGEKCVIMADTYQGYTILTGMSFSAAYQLRNFSVYVNTFMEILAFAVLYAFLYFAMKHVIVNGIRRVNTSLKKITGGDLNEIVNVDKSVEFKDLSNDINLTVATLRNYIDEANERIDQELQFAKNIQYSSLPAITDKFSGRKDMNIFASMDTAKEVGGDFYDFYFTEPDKLTLLIADVSGKGVPAAMFMMRAKTELRAMTENKGNPWDALTAANNELCDGNDAGMFVTAWQASVNLETGILTFANAGHNPPLLKKSGGTFEYVQQKKGFVLAGMEGVKYKPQELQLEPGDIIYLYTDGITEAARENGELYSEARLRGALNEAGDIPVDELCRYIREDIDVFVDGAAQFDDITMLAFEYTGKAPEVRINFEEAAIEDISVITEFVEEELEKIGLARKSIIHFNIAIDEIYSNIVKFAYGEGRGPVSITIKEIEEPHMAELSFIDSGIPHNPLTKESPDITLSAEERPIGGLGIFITRELMDDMKYRYENELNILSIYKKID